MSGKRPILRGIRSDRRGVTAVEFALIVPAMVMTMVGLLEIGYQAYVTVVLQGALNDAARKSTLESAGTKLTSIDQKVKAQVNNISRKATFEIKRKSYSTFTDVGNPEPFTDSNNDGVRNSNECFQDINGNGTFDLDRGKDGLGGADDIVSYTITVTYPRIMPIQVFEWTAKAKVSATTVLRNQPYGNQVVPTVVCAK